MGASDYKGRVLLTRPVASSQALAELLQAQQWETQCLPMMSIEPQLGADKALALERFFNSAIKPSMAVFISVNAVQSTAALLASQNLCWPKDLLCTGIGAATLAAIAAQGWPGLAVRNIDDKDPHSSESLLQRLRAIGLEGVHAGLFCGRGGRGVLQQGLQERGAVVTRLETYVRSKPTYSEQELERALSAFLGGGVVARAMLFASGETLGNFCDIACTSDHWPVLRDTVVVVPSERVAVAAREQGLGKVRVADNASAQAFLRVLTSLRSESL